MREKERACTYLHRYTAQNSQANNNSSNSSSFLLFLHLATAFEAHHTWAYCSGYIQAPAQYFHVPSFHKKIRHSLARWPLYDTFITRRYSGQNCHLHASTINSTCLACMRPYFQASSPLFLHAKQLRCCHSPSSFVAYFQTSSSANRFACRSRSQRGERGGREGNPVRFDLTGRRRRRSTSTRRGGERGTFFSFSLCWLAFRLSWECLFPPPPSPLFRVRRSLFGPPRHFCGEL